MKKTLLLFVTTLTLSSIYAQTKVLFLGNSFTYTYDIPTLFEGFANSAGISVFVDERTAAGIAVYDDPNNVPSGHASSSVSLAKIQSQQWDYVIVQDNIGGWVANFIQGTPGNANVTLANQIKANNNCTHIIYFAAWGPEGGVPSLGYPNETTQSCIERVHTNFVDFNNNAGTYDEIVSPVGKSWIASLSQMPSVDLFHSDNVHPSNEGSYLAAATLFTSIFKKDPTNLTYTGGVSSSTAANMRAIAWERVTNTTIFNETNLAGHTPTVNANGNQLTATGGFAPYTWYLNGNPISGANGSTYTATTSGTYTVLGTDPDGCTDFSFENDLVVTGIENFTQADFQLNTVAYNQYEMISDIMGTVYVYNLQGKLIESFQKTNTNASINLENNSKGLYFVTLVNDTEKITKKITIN